MKQHVVRAILRDIFQKTSHRIYFSSHGILKTSDKIGKISDKIVEKSEKAVECSLFSKFENGKEENFLRLVPSFFPRRRKNLAIFGPGL